MTCDRRYFCLADDHDILFVMSLSSVETCYFTGLFLVCKVFNSEYLSIEKHVA